MEIVADPGGSLGQLPSPNVCGATLNGATLPRMCPFLVPMEVETEIKKKSKINNFFA